MALAAEKITSFLSDTKRMLIGGEWFESISGDAFPVYNPATGEEIARVYEARDEDIDRAVDAARHAFEAPAWRRMLPADRSRLMWKLADLIEANADELTELEVLNQGKPIELARQVDVEGSANKFRYYAGWCTKIEGTTSNISFPDLRDNEASGPAYHAYTLKEPVGVVGAIVPWNVPLLMASGKIVHAITSGCTIVLKPAEETPLTALRLGELVIEAGFPPGVINIVPGYGHIAGAALASHPGVDRISFTGSTEVGKDIVRASAGNLKKVSLELGGKSPVIIFADADLDKAIKGAADTILMNTGQICFAGSRLYVEKSVFNKVIDGVVEIAKNTKLGPGINPETEMGPLISSRQLQRVSEYIESGISEGAEIATGGKRKGETGYFIEPTVFVNTKSQMRIVQEEIFGPVLSTIAIDDMGDISEVATLANDTAYGLSATIWTKDVSRAHRLAAEIKAGVVWVNTPIALDQSLPFGGYKESGWGREGGKEGIEEFTETKSVVISL